MIVVTGGTGTVGSRLVESLLERGKQVRVFCRDAEKARGKFDDRVEIAVGDFTDLDSLRTALTGAERVFLLTASATEPGVQLEHERNVIAATKEIGVGHVVKLSVFGVDENSPIHNARWHRAAEKELEASGLDYTILRPVGFMQNLLGWATDGSIYTCAEDGRFAQVDARDIAAVAAAALTENGHEGKTYNLTGPEALSYDEMVEKLGQASKHDIRHVRMSSEAFIQAMTDAGMPNWQAQDIAGYMTLDYAAGQIPEISGDITAVTGRKARSFDAFAREEFAARMKQPTHVAR